MGTRRSESGTLSDVQRTRVIDCRMCQSLYEGVVFPDDLTSMSFPTMGVGGRLIWRGLASALWHHPDS